MTLSIALLLGLILLALVLFAWDRIEADVIAIGLMVTLSLTGLLPIDRAFEGFGSDTVMLILGLLLLNSALQRNGVMEITGGVIVRLTGHNPHALLAVIMVAAAAVSAFMSNTASAAFFLPVVLGIVAKAGLAPGKFLLPLAFACILSSSVSLISTSTNLVINGLMKQAKLPEMGLFELAPVGIPITVVGLLYVYFIGRHFLPDRQGTEETKTRFGHWPYLTEVIVQTDSPLVGKTIAAAGLSSELDLTVVRVVRNQKEYLSANPDLFLAAEDILLVEASREDLLKIKETKGLEIRADVKFSEFAQKSSDRQFVEVILMPSSRLVGRTLKSFRFRERYQLQVLGLSRRGETIQRKLSQVTLRVGDVLLVEGHPDHLHILQDDPHLRVINQVEVAPPNRRKALLSVVIFIAAILLATCKIMPLALAVLLGVVVIFVTGCISPREAYREVEWKAIMLIGSMLSLGIAMDHTGAAKYLAQQLVISTQGTHPYWLLAGFFILTVVLTQPMSNQAAAVLVVPIAIQTALAADQNPRTFCMMIAVAASCSYLTPLEPACLMVYGPGRYKFSDFLRVGFFLTLIIFGLALWLVPKTWPL